MAFWIFMLASVLLIPGIMIGIGAWFRKSPPRTINFFCGYRTRMSMKNQDTWDFAHRKCGEVWCKWGPWVLVPTVLAMVSAIGQDMDTVGIVGTVILTVQLIPLLASIYPVEKALRENFDQDGNRKQ